MEEKPDITGANPSVWGGLREIISGLADLQLRTVVTTRLAPAIYVLCIAGVAIINLYVALMAFQESTVIGVFWILLPMPIAFLAGVAVVRVALEVILSVFRIVVTMETLMEQIHTLRGQTETIVGRTDEIVEDLPRIQFWRSRKRYNLKTAAQDHSSTQQQNDSKTEEGGGAQN